MTFEIVQKFDGFVVVGDKTNFFMMSESKDGSYRRSTADGLELQTRDLDYAAIGAKLYKSKASCVKAAKVKYAA